MSSFISSPSTFFVSWAPTQDSQEGPGVHLRWMVNPATGMPRVPFQVWVQTDPQNYDLQLIAEFENQAPLTGGDWTRDLDVSGAFVALRLQPAPGRSLTARAYAGPLATGQLLDRRTQADVGQPIWVVLAGNAIRSVRVSGWGAIEIMAFVDIDTVLHSGNWEPLERVGLPLQEEDWGSYVLDDQGFEFNLQAPWDAALRRLESGAATQGWPQTNAFAAPMPNWDPGDVVGYLDWLSQALLWPYFKPMLEDSSVPADDSDYWATESLQAPTSIHGDTPTSDAVAFPSAAFKPLSLVLSAAASDPWAALAMGFGTFLPCHVLEQYFGSDVYEWVDLHEDEFHPGGFVIDGQQLMPGFAGRILVTVEHQVRVGPVPPVLEAMEVDELTYGDVILRAADGPAPPEGLIARHRAFDRPVAVDKPWLETVDLEWQRPDPGFKDGSWARGYALCRELELLVRERDFGGYRLFTPALPEKAADGEPIVFTDRGLPEALGTAPVPTHYDVAARDWFGRWSEWVGVGHLRPVIEPQIPTLMRAELRPLGGAAPTQSAELIVEFAWDWADRRPQTMTVEVKLFPEGGSVPVGTGSVKQVGQAPSPAADLTLDFTAPLPPAVEELPANHAGSAVKRYRATISGVNLNFAAHPVIIAQVRMRASEQVRPLVWSGWTPKQNAIAHSPVPPQRPAAPPGLLWASLPDPKGVSRVRLSWAATAGVRYAIYGGDETALRRELGLAAADLQTRAHERLPALRWQSGAGLRRALRRVAEGIAGGEHELELPRGTSLIHFFVVVGLSESGVESVFPSDTDDWFAVAVPRLAPPTAPQIRVGPDPAGIAVDLELPPSHVAPARVELYRSRNEAAAAELGSMGPPLVSFALSSPPAGWIHTDLGDNGHRLRFVDDGASEDWRGHWYRATSWSASDASSGQLATRSESSRATAGARPAPSGPSITSVSASRPTPGGPLLLRWSTDLPLVQSPLGAAEISLVAERAGDRLLREAQIGVLRGYVGALPDPAEAPAVFRHHASDPELADYAAWIDFGPGDPVDLQLLVRDPAGRRALHSEQVSVP